MTRLNRVVYSAALVLVLGACGSQPQGAIKDDYKVAPGATSIGDRYEADKDPVVVATRHVDFAVSTGVATPEELFDYFATQLIVVGRVTQVRYVTIGEDIGKEHFQFPVTAFTVEVESASDHVSSQIVVRANGGQVPVTQDDRFRLEAEGTFVPDDAVIEWVGLGGARAPAVGARVALFLFRIGNDNVTGAGYMAVGDAAGRFDYDTSSGLFLRAANPSQVLDPTQLDRVLTVASTES